MGPEEFDSGNLEPGESFTFTFTRAGTYPYLDDGDRDDGDFHGTIVVTSEGSSAGGSGTAPNPPSGGGGGGAAPGSATVHMANRTFGPSSVTIAAGGSVMFVNDDDREHTATGDVFETGVLSSGAQSRQTFPTAGTFSFLCQIHPDMRGTVNVRDSSGAVPVPAATPQPTPTPTPVPSIVPDLGTKVASIVDFAFEPGDVAIATGTTVTWQNRGRAPHTVTAADGSFDSGTIAAGDTYSRTFDAPGTFAFACAVHPDMVGTVVVSVGAGGTSAPSASPRPNESPAPPVPNVALGDGAAPDVPPAAAGPDEASPAASIRDGALRLLMVGIVIAGAVIAFGVLIVGTTRRSHPYRGR